MAAPALWRFDRWDERVGILPTLGAIAHSQELGGEDAIELDSPVVPDKGDRLVWRDPDTGAWREHEVVRTAEPLAGVCHVRAEASWCEMLRDFVEDVPLVSKTAAQAMTAALATTRWAPGEVAVGDARHGALLYHTNALAALRRVEEVWGGELEASVAVDEGLGRVTGRTMALLARRGSWRGARLTYGKNLAGCTRTVLEDEVFTALYGWGKGLPVEDEEGQATGAYTRRLSFADANGGVKWVGDDGARLLWGRWDASRGERVHSFGQVVFPECEDPERLLELTRAALAASCAPRVSYECDVATIAGGTPLSLGDDVAVLDSSREPAWRLRARVVRLVRELGEGHALCRATLGCVERTSWDRQGEIEARVSDVEEAAREDAAAAADVAEIRAAVAGSGGTLASVATTEYVDRALEGRLEEIDVSGMGF